MFPSAHLHSTGALTKGHLELGFKFHPVDYVPCYRSGAGTGNAMAFVFWRP